MTDDALTAAIAEVLRRSRMVPYEDGRGGWLFRDATPYEQAEQVAQVVREHTATKQAEALREFALRQAVSAVCDCDGYDGGHDGHCVAWPLLHLQEREPVLPVGTRVRVRSLGAGTVAGPDGFRFDGLAVHLDEPWHGGRWVCATPEECERLHPEPAPDGGERAGIAQTLGKGAQSAAQGQGGPRVHDGGSTPERGAE